MRFDKKQLTLAVASALAAGVAGAAVPVNLDGLTPDPITYVQELNVPAAACSNTCAQLALPAAISANVVLGNTGNTLTTLNPNTAFLRLDLSNGATFGAVPSASVFGNAGLSFTLAGGISGYSASCPAAAATGSAAMLGGAGTGWAIIPMFLNPVTLGTLGAGADAGSIAVSNAINCLNPAGVVSIFAGANAAGSIQVRNKNPVTLTYGLYNALINAQNAAGPYKQVVGSYVNFAPIAAFQATAAAVVADVAASPAFARFVGGGVAAALGQFRAGPTGAVVYLANGVTGGFPDVVNVNAATPPFLFSGNFAVRAAANGVGYNGGGAGACAPITGFGTVGDAAASNAWNNNFTAAVNLCYQVNGTAAIPTADYTVTFAPTAQTGYTVASSTLPIGRITQNGSILIAPLVQNPGSGSTTRLVLTNSGATAQTATVTALGADGNAPTLDPSLASIALPAGKTIVVDLTGKITVPAGAPPRTGLRVVISAPQGAVTGYYQLYNPVSGVVSNFIMPYGS